MGLIDKLTKASESVFEAMNKDEFELIGDAPGPTPKAPLGNAGDFVGHKPWEVLAGYEKEYGGFVRFWLMGAPVILPTAPELTERVFITHRPDFYKDSPVDALTPVLSSVEPFLANIPEWEGISARSLLKMKDYPQWCADLVAGQRAGARARLELLSTAADGDATDAIRRIGFACFSMMAVGHTLDDAAYDAMFRMVEEGDQRMSSPLPQGQTSWDPGFLNARKKFWAAFEEAVAAAKGGDLGDRTDMLAFALRGDTPLDDKELAVSLANLYFSGMFSSSSALLTTLWGLTNHPEDHAAVRAEIDSLDDPNDFTALDALPRTDQCVREAMRLFPPVPVYLRRTAKEREIPLADWKMPKNCQVFLCNFAVHRSARYWGDDADAWNPSRWTPEVVAARPYGSGEYWPFGRGPRACTGERAAIAYIKSALAEAVGNYDVKVGEGAEYDGAQLFGCMTADGWTMSVSKRG